MNSSNPFARRLEEKKKESTVTENPFAQRLTGTSTQNIDVEQETLQPEEGSDDGFLKYLKNIYEAADSKTKKSMEEGRNQLKAALSGATFGGSEYFDSLKPDYEKEGTSIAHLAGAALPISTASKLVGLGARGLGTVGRALGFTGETIPGWVKSLEGLGHAFGTGSTYHAGLEGVKALKGEDVDLTNIPKGGAEFALIHGVLTKIAPYVGKKVYEQFNKISPSQQAKILTDGVIPEGLPRTQEQSAQIVLQTLREKGPQEGLPKFLGTPLRIGEQRQGGRTISAIPPSNTPVSPTVRANFQRMGVEEAPRPSRTEIAKEGMQQRAEQAKERVGNLISPQRFYNTTQGGQALRNNISTQDEEVYRGVNELYRASREANQAINDTHPALVNELNGIINEIEAIPRPSSVENSLLTSARNIRDSLANVEDGVVVGYIDINNQTLIDQIQSLRRMVDYDFAHGKPSNIFRPLINHIQNAVERSAEDANPEAAELWREARSAYRTWTETFDNDYVRPFRDTSNRDFSKLYRSSLNTDEFNMLRPILNLSEEGQVLSRATQRGLVDKELSKYFDNPRNYSPQEFRQAVRELEAVVTPAEAESLNNLFNEYRSAPPISPPSVPRKAVVLSKKEVRDISPSESLAAKYEGKNEEGIKKMMSTPSGIRQLRNDLKEKGAPDKIFDELANSKIKSLLRENQIEKDFTGEQLYKVLNKEKNYELFSEILGEEETEALRLRSKEIGKQEVKKSFLRGETAKTIAKAAIGYKSFKIILSLL